MPADKPEPLIDQLLLLITDTERFQASQNAHKDREHVRRAFSAVLAEFRMMVNAVRNRVRSASQRYVVAFVGAGNVGKSTLLNRLFDTDLAPRRNGPCTSCPVEFHFGEAYGVSVEYFQSLKKPNYYCECSDDVHRHLSGLADSDGAQSSEGIRKISVSAPLEILRNNGLVIADTPGFGAAQVDGADGSHEKALKRYLEKDVSQVFWVVLAEQGITKREIEFQRNVFGVRCQDLVITGSEDYEENDRKRFRRRFAPLFDSIPPTFHFVSGRTGMGVDDLASRIATIDGRMMAADDQLEALAQDLREWVVKYRLDHQYLHLTFWNPVSWSNWVCNNNKHKLTEMLRLDS